LPISLAFFVAIISLIAAGVAFALTVFVVVRSRRFGKPRRIHRSLGRSIVDALLDPVTWGAVLLVGATALPWVSGSVVGVKLPPTLWDLPWARWIIGIPALAVMVVAILGAHRRSAVVKVVTAALFGLCTGLGGIALVLVALAERASRYTFLADTVLRGFHNLDALLPVVRTGAGPLVFIIGGALGALGMPWWWRSRGGVSTVPGVERTAGTTPTLDPL
jgi:hypothetical protein